MAYPDLMGLDKPHVRSSLCGSVDEIAGVLAEYDALGTAHLMFHLIPSTPEAYNRLAQAVHLYRNQKKSFNEMSGKEI
jgi:hypothetical protein